MIRLEPTHAAAATPFFSTDERGARVELRIVCSRKIKERRADLTYLKVAAEAMGASSKK